MLVVGALMAVVIGQAMLANGQVRMAAIEHELTLEQSVHRQIELTDSALETPARIVAAATGGLHMVHSPVIELPYVPLTTPLPAPNVTAPPAVTPPTGTTASTGSTTASTVTSGTTTASTTTSGTAPTTSTP
jgi:hypothetical protein